MYFYRYMYKNIIIVVLVLPPPVKEIRLFSKRPNTFLKKVA